MNGNLKNFTKAPSSSPDALANNSSLDEIHVVVQDEDGSITGIVGEILEVFEGLSMASDAKDSEGNSNYYVNKIRFNSNYIFWTKHNSNTSKQVTHLRGLQVRLIHMRYQ